MTRKCFQSKFCYLQCRTLNGQTAARWLHAALQRFFVAHVTNFKEVLFFWHNFVSEHHNLANFWLKIQKTSPNFFLINFCGPQYLFSCKFGPWAKKSGHPWYRKIDCLRQDFNSQLSFLFQITLFTTQNLAFDSTYLWYARITLFYVSWYDI